MKNVIINKIVKYVLTEDQLKGRWSKTKNDKPFSELSSQEIMNFAKEVLHQLSPSELKEYTLDSPWRTISDVTGEMIADDDTEPTMHVELLDTSMSDNPTSSMVIDRMLKLQCSDCGFEFYIEDLHHDLNDLSCPVDGGDVHTARRNIKTINKNDTT
ncbi:hypothetical protein [Tuberibacillus sp. Marseille-P3662]|uniref:hypothetical protein n=1 Tax=Tuberibacillus sp. Marseille-P3662 TaxID=1965358 RepID=UPI000A1C7B0A|nr:hypothetical protein [Tuberibacillus sp. Marseille-P3662]